jgi:transposase
LEQLDYNLLFRWFVGLEIDDEVWVPTTFTKNRDCLLNGDVAWAFFAAVRAHATAFGWCSVETGKNYAARRHRRRAVKNWGKRSWQVLSRKRWCG